LETRKATSNDLVSAKGAAAAPSPAPTPAAEPARACAPCPGCGSATFQVLFEAKDHLFRTTTETFRIVQCGQCRLIRLDTCPSAAPALEHPARWSTGDSVADRFERAYRRFVISDHVAFVARAVEEAGDAGPVLDLSPEGGLLRSMLAERGIPVIGIDCSPDAAAANWKTHHAASVCARLEAAPVAPSSCRAITMLHVLEHMNNPAALVQTAHALLRPGGRLIVQTPNAACWEFLLLGERWNGLDVPRHRIDFRACDLEVLLQSAGFEVLRRKHFSLRDNPGGLALSLAPGLAPTVRRERGVVEGPAMKLAKHLLWVAMVVASVPFTVLEAACRAGSTVMMEARKTE
jgi:SAM-dependent methyltransferase